jgi:hypothetical protein
LPGQISASYKISYEIAYFNFRIGTRQVKMSEEIQPDCFTLM